MDSKKLVLIDTREKPKAIERIVNHFEANGINYDKTKLYFGDYMEYSNPGTVVDRKQNIAELAKNCTADHERFRRELERVKSVDARLTVLVEQNRYKDRGQWVTVKDIKDIIFWTSPHTKVTGEKVFRVLTSWAYKYPVSFEFCNKRNTGQRISEILKL